MHNNLSTWFSDKIKHDNLDLNYSSCNIIHGKDLVKSIHFRMIKDYPNININDRYNCIMHLNSFRFKKNSFHLVWKIKEIEKSEPLFKEEDVVVDEEEDIIDFYELNEYIENKIRLIKEYIASKSALVERYESNKNDLRELLRIAKDLE